MVTLNLRFIPACAGNALPSAVSETDAAVHPRMCGERARLVASVDWISGSSPHVRGTRLSWSCAPCGPRFIPACAGNAGPLVSRLPVAPVHPRMCGERLSETIAARSLAGSSPHVRGTHGRRDDERIGRRFIPACAGNAKISHLGVGSCTVHPRMCGERMPGATCSMPLYGSSPHVRGTHFQ